MTIWGQSAGGSSCVIHMIAYGGRDDGLFRASHVDSGVFLNGNASLATATPGWNKCEHRFVLNLLSCRRLTLPLYSVVNATGCSNTTDTLDCLRSVPYATYFNASVNTGFAPSVVPDGDIIQSPIPQLIQEGKFVKRCAVFGSNQDEGTCERKFQCGRVNAAHASCLPQPELEPQWGSTPTRSSYQS